MQHKKIAIFFKKFLKIKSNINKKINKSIKKTYHIAASFFDFLNFSKKTAFIFLAISKFGQCTLATKCCIFQKYPLKSVVAEGGTFFFFDRDPFLQKHNFFNFKKKSCCQKQLKKIKNIFFSKCLYIRLGIISEACCEKNVIFQML